MCDRVRSARTTLAVGLLVLVVVAAGQAAEKFPYVGVVTGDDVYVRSADSLQAYPVLKVSRGQHVTVQGETMGWLKIAPLTGTFSWIDKAAVERQGDQGTVIADRVWVRAGSLLRSDRSAPQTRLAKGEKVTILGEDDMFYKIQTPASASLYISAQFVAAEGESAAAAATRPGAAGSQPAVAPAAGAGIITRSSSTTPRRAAAGGRSSSTQPAGKVDWMARFENLEAVIQAERAKPWQERNYDGLLAHYAELAAQTEDDAVAAAAKIRMEDLRNLGNSREILDAISRADAIFKKELELWDRPLPSSSQPDRSRGWDAKGVLRSSVVFSGHNTVKAYRLVNPATDTAVAYVLETPQLARQLQSLVGQYVAVQAAQQSFRSDINVNLIVPANVAEAVPETGEAVSPMEDEPFDDAAASQPAAEAEEK